MIPEKDAAQTGFPICETKRTAKLEVVAADSVHVGFCKYAFSGEADAGATVRHRAQGYVTSLRKPTWRRSQDLAARDAPVGGA